MRRKGDAADGIVEIDLDFPSLRHFQHEFSPYLSPDGLFVPTEFPDPSSTVVRFRVRLPDNFVLVQGTGVVLWTRTRESEPDSEPGMAVRFAALAPQSKDLIDRLVAAHVQRGGAAFGLESFGKPEEPPRVAVPAPVTARPAPVTPRPAPDTPAAQPAPPTKPPAEPVRAHAGVFRIRGAEPAPPQATAPQVSEPEVPKQPSAPPAPSAPRATAPPAPPTPELAPELPPDAELEDLEPEPPAAQPKLTPAAPAPEPAPVKQPEQTGLEWEPPESAGAELATTLTQLALAATPQPPPPGPEREGLEWESFPVEEPTVEPAAEPVVAEPSAAEDFAFVPDAELEPYEPVEPEPAPPPAPTKPAAPATPAEPPTPTASTTELPGYQRGSGRVFDRERATAGASRRGKVAAVEPGPGGLEKPAPVAPEHEPEPTPHEPPVGGPAEGAPTIEDVIPSITAEWDRLAGTEMKVTDEAAPPAEPDARPDDWLKVFEQPRTTMPEVDSAGPDLADEPTARSPVLDVDQADSTPAATELPARDIPESIQRSARSSAARRPAAARKSRLWVVLPVLAALAVIAATTAWLLPGLLGGSHQAASTTPTAATPVVEAPTPDAEPTSSATTAGSTAVVPTAAQPTPLPEPSPTAAPAPTTVPMPSTPASTIRDISWAQQGDVAVITMRADGSLGRDRVAVDLLGDPPRVLARVKGITKPYPQLEIPVGTATVAKIRVGHHAEVSPPALYVVLDLASEGLKVKSVEAAGGELRITVGR